jgi:nucleotide-binding universal stress UspA family protein
VPHRLSRKTLVIHDGSKPVNRAFERALALTLWAESELHAMYMSESPPQSAASVAQVNDHKETAEAVYDDFAAGLRRQAAGKEVSLETHFQCGQDVETIVSFIRDQHFDLVVIGVASRAKILKKLVGDWLSTSQKLAPVAPCTVLMVK